MGLQVGPRVSVCENYSRELRPGQSAHGGLSALCAHHIVMQVLEAPWLPARLLDQCSPNGEDLTHTSAAQHPMYHGHPQVMEKRAALAHR